MALRVHAFERHIPPPELVEERLEPEGVLVEDPDRLLDDRDNAPLRGAIP
jgi:hypothetical protein